MEWYSTVARKDKNNAFYKVTKRKLGLLNEKNEHYLLST